MRPPISTTIAANDLQLIAFVSNGDASPCSVARCRARSHGAAGAPTSPEPGERSSSLHPSGVMKGCRDVPSNGQVMVLAEGTTWVDRWVPGVGTLRAYRRDWLHADVVAGVVLA